MYLSESNKHSGSSVGSAAFLFVFLVSLFGVWPAQRIDHSFDNAAAVAQKKQHNTAVYAVTGVGAGVLAGLAAGLWYFNKNKKGINMMAMVSPVFN